MLSVHRIRNCGKYFNTNSSIELRDCINPTMQVVRSRTHIKPLVNQLVYKSKAHLYCN